MKSKFIFAASLILVFVVVSSPSVFAGENQPADDLLSQFFDTYKSEIEKTADDPSKFLEYVNSQKDVNVRYQGGETLLHIAANRGYRDIVTVLVKRGADINARDKDGRTPLHEAMSYHRYDIARFLIEKGANMHARDKDSETPLIAIVYMDDKKLAAELVNFFINHGFDVKKYGDARLLNEAILRDHAISARILIEKGTPFNDSSLYTAATAGYDDIFDTLLEKGANPAQKGILHAAAGSGNVNILKTLVRKGAGVTPDDVDFAVFKGNAQAAVYLNDQLKKSTGTGVDIKARCGLEPQGGSCKARFEKGYYNKKNRVCMSFTYGGCAGVVPFDSIEACRNICE